MIPWEAIASGFCGLIIGLIVAISSLWRSNVTRGDVLQMITENPKLATIATKLDVIIQQQRDFKESTITRESHVEMVRRVEVIEVKIDAIRLKGCDRLTECIAAHGGSR